MAKVIQFDQEAGPEDCHYYEPNSEDFDGCSGPWSDNVCAICYYRDWKDNKPVEPTAKVERCKWCGYPEGYWAERRTIHCKKH